MHNRQIDMLRTAIPYTMPNVRKPIQILLQVQELASYIQNDSDEPELEACSLENVGDIEGMMESLREYCTAKEKDTVDMVLNYIRVQRMYQTYKTYTSLNEKMNNESNKNNGNQKARNQNSSNNMMEFLMSQLTPEQQRTFAQMSSLMNTE